MWPNKPARFTVSLVTLLFRMILSYIFSRGFFFILLILLIYFVLLSYHLSFYLPVMTLMINAIAIVETRRTYGWQRRSNNRDPLAPFGYGTLIRWTGCYLFAHLLASSAPAIFTPTHNIHASHSWSQVFYWNE